MGKISITTRLFSFEVPILQKITILTGYSAIGKTTFIEELEKDGNKVYSDYKLVRLPLSVGNLSYESYLSQTGDNNTLFYSDEDIKYLSSREFQTAVNATNSFFLFVNREQFSAIPYGYKSIYTFTGFVRNSVAELLYVEHTRAENISFNAVNTVCTEDSNSGHQFFKSFSSLPVQSSNGKDNIPRLLQEYEHTLFLIDGCGCGATLNRIFNHLTVYNTNQVLILDSFEEMVLKSTWLNTWVEPDCLCSNVEVYATQLLIDTLKTYNISYSKKKCPSCLMENCDMCQQKCQLLKLGSKCEMIACELYCKLTTSHNSDMKSDKEIAQEIINADSTTIVGLASQFSPKFKADHNAIDFNNALSIQMHCQMLLDLNQI